MTANVFFHCLKTKPFLSLRLIMYTQSYNDQLCRAKKHFLKTIDNVNVWMVNMVNIINRINLCSFGEGEVHHDGIPATMTNNA